MNSKNLSKLSPGLRKLISKDNNRRLDRGAKTEPLSAYMSKRSSLVSAFAERTLNHCNGGSTMDAALWLKTHLKNGGKLVITIAGALGARTGPNCKPCCGNGTAQCW